MFFILSKILAFLASPATWIVGMLVAHWLVRSAKWKKRLLTTGIVMVVVLTNPFLATVTMSAWEVDPVPLDQVKPHDIGVVFTGMTMKGHQPDDRVYFDKASDRMLMAVHLYRVGKIKKILITGGKGELFGDGAGETPVLHRFLRMIGIPEEDILLEPRANNTYENALFTKEMVAGTGQTCILITSASHMRRSLGCCEKVGLKVTPFPVDYRARAAFHSVGDVLVPSAISLYQWRTLWHEWLGYVSYSMLGKI